MHELSLSQRLIEIVTDQARRHDLDQVSEVRLGVGALSCVTPEALTFCFDAVAKGTVAEGATLRLVQEPTEAWCWTCEQTVQVADAKQGCPACGNQTVRAADPRDMRVLAITG